MKLKLKRGTTAKIVRLWIQDSSQASAAGLTGLTNASAGLIAYYAREGDSGDTAITLAAGTVGTWSSGGFKEIDAAHMPGLYEFGLPDAAISTGNSVVIMLSGATNMIPVLLEIELDAVDYQDPVRHGATSLPNVAAGGNGGLPLGDANSRVDIGRWIGTAPNALASGRVDASVGVNNDKAGYALTAGEHTNIAADDVAAFISQGYTAARAVKLDDLDAPISSRQPVGAGVRAIVIQIIGTGSIAVPGALVEVTDPTGSVIDAYSATDASGMVHFNLNDGTYSVRVVTGPAYAPLAAQSLMVSADATVVYTLTAQSPTPPSAANVCRVFGFMRDTQGQPRNGSKVSFKLNTAQSADLATPIRTGTAQAAGASTITLDSGASGTDNFYNGKTVTIISGTGAGQVRTISAYVGATKIATVGNPWGTIPDNTSVFTILTTPETAFLIRAEVDVTTDANGFFFADLIWSSTIAFITGSVVDRTWTVNAPDVPISKADLTVPDQSTLNLISLFPLLG